MNLLLDTHVFLWSLMETSRLSSGAVRAMLNPENQVSVSAVTFWEIALKESLGKLELSGLTPAELPEIAALKMGFNLLALDAETAAGSGKLPRLHADPFDRLLIYQAVAGGFNLVSADTCFSAYQTHGLTLLW